MSSLNRESLSHREAVELLPDLAVGADDATPDAALRAHLRECPGCREWLETARLLRAQLRGANSGSGEHPDSELLAVCAVRPEEVYEPERAKLRAHLEACEGCRREIETLSEALRSARPSSISQNVPRFRVDSRSKVIRWSVLAASLGVLGIGLGVAHFAVSGNPERGVESRLEDPAPDDPSSRVDDGSGETVELANLELGDSRLIETDRGLTVSHVKVKSGARVTFRVGGVAAFGDGFQISDGGAVTVEAGVPQGKSVKRRNS